MKKHFLALGLTLFTLNVSANPFVFIKLGNNIGKTAAGDLCYVKVTGTTVTVGLYERNAFWRAITLERSDIRMSLENGILRAAGASYEDSAIKLTAKMRPDMSIELAHFNMGYGYSKVVKCLNMK